MKKFFIIVNMDKDPELNTTKKLCSYLDQRGLSYGIKKLYPLAEALSLKEIKVSDVPAGTDLIIILGGDGSFLNSAVSLAELNIPVAGLNLGTLGYLAQFNSDSFESEIDELIWGESFIEERQMLTGELIREGQVIESSDSLNDIVIRRCDGLSAIQLELALNGQLMKKSICDGVIISTPTGSTAYNLSVGGAVIEPSSRVNAITFMAPHALSYSNIIVSDDAEISVSLPSIPRNYNINVQIGFDGRHITEMQAGDILRIHRSKYAVKLLRSEKYNFFDVLRDKMRGD